MIYISNNKTKNRFFFLNYITWEAVKKEGEVKESEAVMNTAGAVKKEEFRDGGGWSKEEGEV